MPMVDPIKIELNIALAPSRALGANLTKWSQAIAKQTKNTLVMLGEGETRLSDVPHLTLYQVPILARDLDQLAEQLQLIAEQEAPYDLTVTNLTYNADERSLEIGYETQPRLVELQMKVTSYTNILRQGMLLEKDPAGNRISELLHVEGELGENIRNFGYSEIGGLFRPHATLNWFGPDTDFAIETEQKNNCSELSGQYDTLIISALGSHGRCAQQLTHHKLDGNLAPN